MTMDKQNYVQLIKDTDALSSALNLSDCAPELQLQIIGQWSSLLFKRLLLRIPAEQTTEIQNIILENVEAGKDIGLLIQVISTHIPNFEQTIEEEIAKAIGEFRLPKA